MISLDSLVSNGQDDGPFALVSMVIGFHGHWFPWSLVSMVIGFHGHWFPWSLVSMVIGFHGHWCPWSAPVISATSTWQPSIPTSRRMYSVLDSGWPRSKFHVRRTSLIEQTSITTCLSFQLVAAMSGVLRSES